MGQDGTFEGRHFSSEVILWTLRWFLAFPISYLDLSAMLSDRGVMVDHTTLFRWVQTYAAKLEQRGPAPFAPLHRIVAGGRDLHQG